MLVGTQASAYSRKRGTATLEQRNRSDQALGCDCLLSVGSKRCSKISLFPWYMRAKWGMPSEEGGRHEEEHISACDNQTWSCATSQAMQSASIDTKGTGSAHTYGHARSLMGRERFVPHIHARRDTSALCPTHKTRRDTSALGYISALSHTPKTRRDTVHLGGLSLIGFSAWFSTSIDVEDELGWDESDE
jgi:hypothetical protein